MCRRSCVTCGVLLCFIVLTPAVNRAQTAKPARADPIPKPAIPAILAVFDKYEVVGLPQGHREKDVDNFILSLIRNPSFPEKVNDIEVECGNSLYQPILDRYIAGEDVPFAEVRNVWRNTTQRACDLAGLSEQLFPLVRAINQKLPAWKRLRVLAGDSPIDWDGIKSASDLTPFYGARRDATMASVLEKEVLSKRRKALMLIGTRHLMHGGDALGVTRAVNLVEKSYPNVIFVIEGLSYFKMDLDSPAPSFSPFAKWPAPSLVLAKGTWLGALEGTHFTHEK